MEEPTDNALWRRASRGDPEAFGALFERHGKAIYNYLFRRCGDWALAEDLTSVVFLEAWRRRAAPVHEGKVLPWLYGVATNVLRNQRRSLRRHAAALSRVPAPAPDDDAGDTADRIDAERRMRAVLGVVDRLPSAERDVLALCAWSELSYADAAAALGIPIGTVRSRFSRARARLAELTESSGHELDAVTTTEEA